LRPARQGLAQRLGLVRVEGAGLQAYRGRAEGREAAAGRLDGGGAATDAASAAVAGADAGAAAASVGGADAAGTAEEAADVLEGAEDETEKGAEAGAVRRICSVSGRICCSWCCGSEVSAGARPSARKAPCDQAK